MKMPTLRPVPIRTKGRSFWKRSKRWVTLVRKWEVAENWEYLHRYGLVIVIPKGFIFDGASIPKALWSMMSPTGLLLLPGLIHDFAYRYNYIWTRDSNGNYLKFGKAAGRRYWDNMFKEIGDDVNGMKVLDWTARLALKLGGGSAWKANRKRNAPEMNPA